MRFIQRAQPDDAAAAQIEGAGFSPLLAKLLSMRGVKDAQQAERFLKPDLADLYDPFLLNDMQKAVDRIRLAIESKQRIVVFGDYDVDGVTATAIMLSYLRSKGAQAGYYLPSRHGEGYGLNEASVRSLSGAYDLMITVDCGITCANEVRIAKECGMDVIVTDHHEPTDDLPDCPCVDPKLGYPFSGLCGAGVAGKLVQALGGIEALTPLLDLVSLGTIADIVPLVDENRILAYAGLAQINKKQRPGISALVEVSGLLGKEITAGHISFMIAPRINAGGRMGHSGRSVDMLLEQNRRAALDIAKELDESNRQRQAQEQEIFGQALALAQEVDLRSARCLVLAGDGWNPGVIGIVASRMVERFSRPVFLLSRDGDTCVGSGRSVPGVSLFQALDAMGELFIRYGGHDMAAGLTIHSDSIDAFRLRMQQVLEQYAPDLFLPSTLYDLDASVSQMTPALVEELDKLDPTGQGNPMPIFRLNDAQVDGLRTVGQNGAHLRMRIGDGAHSVNAVAFRMGEQQEQAQGNIDALVTPEVDSYAGDGSIRLLVRAFRPSRQSYRSVLEKNAPVLLRDTIAALSPQASTGFRVHLPMRDRAHLLEVAAGLMRQMPGGVLLLCALPETALELETWLEAEGLEALARKSMGGLTPLNGAQHALHCPLVFDSESLGGFRHIFLPDGLWAPSMGPQLQAASGGAILYAPSIPDAARGAIARCLPDVPAMRILYKILRARAAEVKRAASFGALLAIVEKQISVSPATLEITLQMLRDMDLATYTPQPFQLELTQNVQGKRDAQQTRTYLFYSTLAGGIAQ